MKVGIRHSYIAKLQEIGAKPLLRIIRNEHLA